MKKNELLNQLLNNYYQSSYEYLNKFRFEEYNWNFQYNYNYELTLIKNYLLLKRATESIKDAKEYFEANSIPENLDLLLIDFHKDHFKEYYSAHLNFNYNLNKYRLLEIDKWLKSIDYTEDIINYLTSTELFNQIKSSFFEIDLIVLAKYENLCQVSVEDSIKLIEDYIDLFKIITSTIGEKCNEYLVPQNKKYNYWYFFEDIDLKEYIKTILGGKK